MAKLIFAVTMDLSVIATNVEIPSHIHLRNLIKFIANIVTER